MEEDERRSFAELFRRLIEFELPPVEKFQKILVEILRLTANKKTTDTNNIHI